MSVVLTDKIDRLKDRAFMFAKVRHFFHEREVLEVDVPILSKSASVDADIDLIQASGQLGACFLHSSPEYGMKRLLAEGIGDIYQLSHVFRDGEKGNLHNPEFSMVEWYRIGFAFEEMIRETVDFCRLFFDFSEVEEYLSYREAFQKYVGHFPNVLEERDYLFAFEIEPHLGKNGPTVISGFPKEQAALSELDERGLAKRFEIYYAGIELANGYQELLDPIEQKERLNEANKRRLQKKKSIYPIDENFLAALEKGIPSCTGVACGFDRLMMLRHRVDELKEIVPFSWDET